jgi:hypothetical protein
MPTYRAKVPKVPWPFFLLPLKLRIELIIPLFRHGLDNFAVLK